MAESVKLELTEAEANALSINVAENLAHDHSFMAGASTRDEQRLIAYLKLEHARVAAGASRGPDLELPPWAGVVILDRLFPKPVKAKLKPKPAKPAKKAKAPRKKRPSELRKEAARREADRPLPGMTLDDDGDGDLERPE